MTDLDERIRAALRDEDRELFDQLAEQPSVTETIRDGFSGKWGWWMIAVAIVQTVIFGLGIWCAVRFVNAEGVDDHVVWGTWMLLAGVVVAQLKIMAWMQMQHMSVHRELKRLELQILRLGRHAPDTES